MMRKHHDVGQTWTAENLVLTIESGAAVLFQNYAEGVEQQSPGSGFASEAMQAATLGWFAITTPLVPCGFGGYAAKTAGYQEHDSPFLNPGLQRQSQKRSTALTLGFGV